MTSALNMFLSIVIPTRNRAKDLEATLHHFGAIIERDPRRDRIELLCVDNFSRDQTREIAESLSLRYPFIQYRKQPEERDTAERSAFGAAVFASGEYIWFFGDDDTPLPDCLDRLWPALEQHKPDFALLNARLNLGDRIIDYIRADSDILVFPSGAALFSKFGFISATTTLSCLCYRREALRATAFWELSAISEIYSHSFALFASFHDKKCLFLATPVLDYRQNSIDQEASRFGEYTQKTHRSPYSPFVTGVVRLLNATARLSGRPGAALACFEEIEISKTSWTVKHTVLWCFVARMWLAQLETGHRLTDDENTMLAEFFSHIDDPAASACALYLRTHANHAGPAPTIKPPELAAFERYENNRFLGTHKGTPVHFLYFQKNVCPVILYDSSDPAVATTLSIEIVTDPAYPRQLKAGLERLKQDGLHLTKGLRFTVILPAGHRPGRALAKIVRKWSQTLSGLALKTASLPHPADGAPPDNTIHLTETGFTLRVSTADRILPVSLHLALCLLQAGPARSLVFNPRLLPLSSLAQDDFTGILPMEDVFSGPADNFVPPPVADTASEAGFPHSLKVDYPLVIRTPAPRSGFRLTTALKHLLRLITR